MRIAPAMLLGRAAHFQTSLRRSPLAQGDNVEAVEPLSKVVEGAESLPSVRWAGLPKKVPNVPFCGTRYATLVWRRPNVRS